jgi:hypothetical protein
MRATNNVIIRITVWSELSFLFYFKYKHINKKHQIWKPNWRVDIQQATKNRSRKTKDERQTSDKMAPFPLLFKSWPSPISNFLLFTCKVLLHFPFYNFEKHSYNNACHWNTSSPIFPIRTDEILNIGISLSIWLNLSLLNPGLTHLLLLAKKLWVVYAHVSAWESEIIAVGDGYY